MKYYDRHDKPMIDQGTLALVALAIIAHDHSRPETKKLSDRLLTMALEHLDSNDAEVKAELERRRTGINEDPSPNP